MIDLKVKITKDFRHPDYKEALLARQYNLTRLAETISSKLNLDFEEVYNDLECYICLDFTKGLSPYKSTVYCSKNLYEKIKNLLLDLELDSINIS